MKIPLSMFALDDSILIYRNGGVDKVDFPFKPFVLVEKDKFPELLGTEEVWHKVPDDEDRVYRRLMFNTTKDVMEFKKRNSGKARHIFSNNYAEQLYVSAEDFLLNYPHSNDLTIMFWDIEVASKGDGLFPKALTNEILAIGYSIWKYDNNGNKRKVCQSICKGFDITTMSDKPVIDSFLAAVQEHDPDVMAGYNTDEFDFPYLIERAQIVGSDLTKLGRGGREPTIRDEGDIKIRIPGRIHFDMYNSNSGVVKDQSLFGIKSKTLKDLGRWYKAKRTRFINDKWVVDEMDDIEVKEHIEDLLKLFRENPDLLYAYLDDDVYRTEGVGHVYLRNCITLAEMMHVPLDNIICMYSSFVPKLLVARNMEKLRLINTESNFNRYNINTGSIAKIGLKYEGAVVGLYKDGYQPAIWKLDFQSQYPSSIQTWNLGPDTTSLVRVEEYTGQYNCIVEGNYNWYRIPTYFEDGKYKYDLIVKVRNDKEGFLKQAITNFKAERKKIRNEMKSLSENDDKYSALYAQQLAIKVIMNSIYGFLGLKTSIYGDMVSATMVTSLCRWCILKCMQRNEDILIEVDTDGFIINKKLDHIEETAWLDKEIKDKFHISDNHMQLELEGDGEAAYFYMMKNYIKMKDPGKYEIHGSSFKTSRSSKIVDRAIKLGINHVFNNKPIEEVLQEAYDFKGLSIEDFSERVKMAKDPMQYDDQYDWRLFLAKQVEMKTGQIITSGAQMLYVVTKDQLPQKEFKQYYRSGKNYTYIAFITDIKELDLDYYIELVDKALLKFGISKTKYMQTSLFVQPEKTPIKKSELDVVPKDKL